MGEGWEDMDKELEQSWGLRACPFAEWGQRGHAKDLWNLPNM